MRKSIVSVFSLILTILIACASVGCGSSEDAQEVLFQEEWNEFESELDADPSVGGTIYARKGYGTYEQEK